MGIRQRWSFIFVGMLAAGVMAGCTKDDAAEGKGNAKAGEPAELFVSTLHDLNMPDPGTAWIEVDGERIEFPTARCKHEEFELGERLSASANVNDDTHGPTEISVKREVGDGVRLPFEYELVQLTLVGGTETRTSNGIGMLQHSHYKKDGFKWLRGSGDIPAVRIVGQQLTAQGNLEASPFSERPLIGKFTLALSCPE